MVFGGKCHVVFIASTGLPGIGLPRRADRKYTSYTLRIPTYTRTGLTLGWGDIRDSKAPSSPAPSTTPSLAAHTSARSPTKRPSPAATATTTTAPPGPHSRNASAGNDSLPTAFRDEPPEASQTIWDREVRCRRRARSSTENQMSRMRLTGCVWCSHVFPDQSESAPRANIVSAWRCEALRSETF